MSGAAMRAATVVVVPIEEVERFVRKYISLFA
jgi:hypothetical protein